MRRITLMLLACLTDVTAYAEEIRPRARDAGITVGIFAPGTHNAITDVEGVSVGHSTLIEGDDVRTGVTAIIPAEGNLYQRPLPAAVHVGNGYGKMTGISQIQELGTLESPIVLTCTLCVWRAADALKTWAFRQPGMGQHTFNPVVGETNDGRLNNQWQSPFPLRDSHVFAALDNADSGPVAEGSVGAGTGTQAFAWKGGIGTSSRVLPEALGGWTVGVLVQTNYGGVLSVAGAPVGQSLKQYAFRGVVEPKGDRDPQEDGSIMIVVATDAPLRPQSLERVAARAIMGLARTGSYAGNGSGDYVIAFSTHADTRIGRDITTPMNVPVLGNAALSPLFAATVEATEEAIYNAIFKATTVRSSRGTLEAIPMDALLEVLARYGVIPPHSSEAH